MKFLTQFLFYSVAISAIIFPVNSAYADSKRLCGNDVSFNAVVPAANVPDDVKAFYGNWVGETQVSQISIPCSAFSFHEVDASGRVKLLHTWGDPSAAGSFGNASGKIGPIYGQVTNGTLAVESAKAIQYLRISKSNPNRIEGEWVNKFNNSRYPVILNRVP